MVSTVESVCQAQECAEEGRVGWRKVSSEALAAEVGKVKAQLSCEWENETRAHTWASLISYDPIPSMISQTRDQQEAVLMFHNFSGHVILIAGEGCRHQTAKS